MPSLLEEGVAGPSLSDETKALQSILAKEPEDSKDAGMDSAAKVVGTPTGRDSSGTSVSSQMDLGLPPLSPKAPSTPSVAQLEKALTTPFPVTVPGMSSPLSYGDAASAKALFPPVLPASMTDPAKGQKSFHADPKKAFPVTAEHYNTCHPPCIQGRGICNDNLCFCKSPFTGTTCQHKLGTLARVSYVMLVAASIVSLFFGVLLAQGVHALINQHFEQRLAWLGDGFIKKEVWTPPQGGKAVPRGHKVEAHQDAHPTQEH